MTLATSFQDYFKHLINLTSENIYYFLILLMLVSESIVTFPKNYSFSVKEIKMAYK
jgi:hypothetical protein